MLQLKNIYGILKNSEERLKIDKLLDVGPEEFSNYLYPEMMHLVILFVNFIVARNFNYIKGESINKCLDYASKVSSFVVSHMDAVPDYEIDDLITYHS